MSRGLKRSEILLLGMVLLLVLGLGTVFFVRDYRTRTEAAREKIDQIESDLAGRSAASSDRGFWERRNAWLDETMPVMEDAGTAQSELLEFIQTTAAERQLGLSQPALLKPEGGPFHHELAVSVRAVGPDLAVLRWLAEMQSPEKFVYLKTLALSPETRRGRPIMVCTVTIARWFRK